MENEFSLNWFNERTEQFKKEFDDLTARFSDVNNVDDREMPTIDVQQFILAFETLSLSQQTGYSVEENDKNDEERTRFKKMYDEFLLKSRETAPVLCLDEYKNRDELVYPDEEIKDDREFYKYMYHQWNSEDFINELYDEFVSRKTKLRDVIENSKNTKAGENDVHLSLTEALRDENKWAKYIQQGVMRAEAMEKLVTESQESSIVCDGGETWDSFIRGLRNDNYIVEALTSDESELSEDDEFHEPFYSYSSAIEFTDDKVDMASYLIEIHKDAERRQALEAAKLPPIQLELDWEDKEEVAREDADIDKRRSERNNVRDRKNKSKKQSKKEEFVVSKRKPSKEFQGKSDGPEKKVEAAVTTPVVEATISKSVVEPVKHALKGKPKNDSSSDEDLAALEAMAAGKLKSKR